MTLRFALVLLLLLPGVAAAQETPGRLRHSFAQVTDTVALHRLEQEYARGHSSASSVAAGLAALRLWEVTGERGHARRSRNHFDRAADEDSRNAWAHYGHALSLEAEMREPGLIVAHVNAMRDLGMDAVSRARRALERAVALDPDLPGAVELLAKYAAQTDDEESLLQAKTVFEQAVESARDGTHGLLGIARTARELGDFEEAANAAGRAISRAPRSAEAHLELAIALASVADSLAAAGRAWQRSLELADSSLLQRLWDDAAMIRAPRDVVAWRNAEGDAARQRDVLRTMWNMRGVLGGLSGPERAAEHYRRIGIASERFGRRGMFGAAPSNALRLGTIHADYDDRGVIYIRHGEPEQTVGVPPLQDYIAWFYTDESGDPLSFHFARMSSDRDYRLVYDLPCSIDAIAAAYDPRLAPLARGRCDPLRRRSISARVNRDVERALETDSHTPRFDAAIPFHYDWYTFRADGATELLMAVGVPLERLPPGPRSLRVRLSLVNIPDYTVTHAERVTELVARDTTDGLIVRTHLGLTAGPVSGSYRIDVRDASDERVGTIYGGAVVLPDYRGDTLMVSDVMLAQQSDTGAVMRGDTRLALAPTQVFRGGQFRAYYEIYNIPANTPYTTELVVEPLEGGGVGGLIRRLFGKDDGVRLQFDDVAPADGAATLTQVRDITAPFRPGPYLLHVSITAEGRTITRARRFWIDEYPER